MPAMPRTSKKAREIAYALLGCPPCLEDEFKTKKTKEGKDKKEHESSEIKLDSILGSRIP